MVQSCIRVQNQEEGDDRSWREFRDADERYVVFPPLLFFCCTCNGEMNEWAKDYLCTDEGNQVAVSGALSSLDARSNETIQRQKSMPSWSISFSTTPWRSGRRKGRSRFHIIERGVFGTRLDCRCIFGKGWASNEGDEGRRKEIKGDFSNRQNDSRKTKKKKEKKKSRSE